ncbi:MAG: class I SAM-dependent methyltransferase [Solirubrobacteraceae bacterium]
MSFEELKERQAAAWGAAPFERVAETAGEVHDDLVASLAPKSGERWLDVATGTGAVAIRAARAGADVLGVDISPELIDTARQLAAREGLHVRFEVGDAERLQHGDASFDVVASAQGTMFAPDHKAVARELIRVCRPGGRLGLTCWRPGGAIETFFSLLAGFQAPSPPGVGRPLDWGRAEHVRELLGEAFELELLERSSPQAGQSGEELWQLFSTSFGPLKTLADSLDGDRREQLHHAFVRYYESYRNADGIAAPREYLLILGSRRALSID